MKGLVVLGFLVPAVIGTGAAPEAAPKRLIVVIAKSADCICPYDVEESVGPGNNACVTVALTILVQGPPPTCFIPEKCGPQRDCAGSFRLDVQIVNWAACCAGDMNTCVNGAFHSTIPNGFGGTNPHTVSGSRMACQKQADSVDSDGARDWLKVVCGNDCNAGVMWTSAYREYCYHCPAGDAQDS